MAEFNIDTNKISEDVKVLDKEISKYNDAIENIYQVLATLGNAASGTDVDKYIQIIQSSKDEKQYIQLGERLTEIVKAFDAVESNLNSCVNNNKIG